MGHPLGATGAMILGTRSTNWTHRQEHGAYHPLHRRRHGHGHRYRASLRRLHAEDRRRQSARSTCVPAIRRRTTQLVAGRSRKPGSATPSGSIQFGVNLTTLKSGSASALRHWHENEDEFVYVLEGELVLVENDGETIMRPGDAAGFKAGVANAETQARLHSAYQIRVPA